MADRPDDGAGPGDHLDEELDALIDGELDPEAQEAADRHLAACAGCRRRLEEASRVRDLLRSLPVVDPPAGFVDGFISARHRRRGVAVALVGLASVAAVITLVVGQGATEVPAVHPEPDALAAAHLDHPGGEPMAPDDLPAPMPEVDELAGMPRTAAFAAGDLVHVVFDGSGSTLSLFEAYGRLDWSGSDRQEMAEHMELAAMEVAVDDRTEQGWMVHLDSAHLLVVEVDGIVYALVGEGPPTLLVEAARELPGAEDPALYDRAVDLADSLTGSFSP